MKEKKLSIIIPCYNSAKYITKCLDSIPYREDTEVICINDGSTDNTLGILKEYQNSHNINLNIISYGQNKGVSYARNRGLNKAIGKYILMIDSDDTINSDVFNDIVDDELKIVDIVFFNMIDNKGIIYEVNPRSVMNRVGNFKFVKREFIGKTRYRVGVQRGEDAIFHEALMCKSPTLRCTNKLMYNYNYPRKGSLTDLCKTLLGEK